MVREQASRELVIKGNRLLLAPGLPVLFTEEAQTIAVEEQPLK